MVSSVDQALINRLVQLIAQGQDISGRAPRHFAVTYEVLDEVPGWLAAVNNLVAVICPLLSPYRIQIGFKAAGPHTSDKFLMDSFRDVLSILKQLEQDVRSGLISQLEDRASAKAFDDFLDHADEYVREGRHQESGVIAGVVFEDAVKRVAKKAGAADTTGKVDQIISYLVSKQVFTDVAAKRCRVAAAVRTASTHADWDKFSLDDVKAAIVTTRELIANHLDN